jgi:hypothetical protein
MFVCSTVRKLLHHRGQAAGVAEVLHQELAAGLQVDEAGQFAGEAVEVLHGERHAHAAGDRDQVDHRVGRAADGGVDADGVLEGLAGEDLRQQLVLVHHVDDAPAGLRASTLRRPSTAG